MQLSEGDKVVFMCEPHKGKTGNYMHHGRDSGYLVPFIMMPNGVVRKPWEHEIACKRLLTTKVKELKDELKKLEDDLEFVSQYDQCEHL